MGRVLRCRRGSFVLVVGLCWLLVFVAGCSGSEPSPAPTSRHPGTAATSTPTSPSADPTDIAAAAAIAAVKKLYAELNRSLHTGETRGYRNSFARSCTLCVGNADTIDRIHREKQRIVGGDFTVTRLVVVWNKPDLVIVQGELRSKPLTVRAGSRVVDRDSGSPPTSFTWDYRPVGATWAITAVEVLK
jgi:hypothetical protein